MATDADNNFKHKDTEKMQEANATGAGQNEQGRASFTTGSTTGGGSNYGQGSHHLGGESYKQGSTANAGANYGNETENIGSSSTGTSNEGSSSANAGAARTGASGEQAAGNTARDSDTVSSAAGGRNQGEEKAHKPEEGERRDISSLEGATHLDSDNTAGQRRAEGGSWSSVSNS